MHQLLLNDLQFTSIYKKGRLRFVKSILSPSFQALLVYRLSALVFQFNIPIVPRILWWVNFLVFKVDIDFRSELKGAIYMPHPMGIVIGEHVEMKVGSRLKIMQGVTIGGDLGRYNAKGDQVMYQPCFFGNVFLGVNSIIVGPIVQEGNVFVAANTIVSKSMSEGLYFGINEKSEIRARHLSELGL